MRTLSKILITTLVFPLLSFDLPKGWITGKGVQERYDVGLDKNAGRFGSDAGTIKCLKDKEPGFGTLFQYCIPDKYLGKRVKLSGYMKTKDVTSWAGFWVRVDQQSSKEALSFDNMFERSLKGSTDWTFCEIILDVPINASNIAIGALLDGPGQIWIDDLKFEIVDNTIPTTGIYKSKTKGNPEPANLNFDN